LSPQRQLPYKKNTTAKKNATVKKFIERQQHKHEKDMSIDRACHACNREELFAEKFSKFTVRDYRNTGNTRMNINNAGWSAQQEKRDRMVQYW
tara:strand:+ start:738 stop:1016 length:279 start_codon:yes stop_codon:yes gene_type:complete